eukprot:2153433-Alexandrium_andersonii.AAC.1
MQSGSSRCERISALWASASATTPAPAVQLCPGLNAELAVSSAIAASGSSAYSRIWMTRAAVRTSFDG